MGKKTLKHKNPFAAYQQKRKAETVALVKGAIDRIIEIKGKVSYNTVAKVAGRTEMAIRKNKDAALLVEQGMATQRGSMVSTVNSYSVMPTNLDDCHMLLRIQKATIGDLKKRVNTYSALVKRYNLDSDGRLSQVGDQKDIYRAAIKVIMSILDEGIYKLTENGISSASGKLIVSSRLCNEAGLVSENAPISVPSEQNY